MDRTRIIPGRLVGPTHVELDEPVNAPATIEVIVRDRSSDNTEPMSLVEFLRSLPPGNRTREDIDAQMQEERSAWDERA